MRGKLQVNHVGASRSGFYAGTFIVFDKMVVADANVAVESESVRQVFDLVFSSGVKSSVPSLVSSDCSSAALILLAVEFSLRRRNILCRAFR